MARLQIAGMTRMIDAPTVRQGGTLVNMRPMTRAGRGRVGIEMTTESFRAIEEYLRWAESIPAIFPRAMDTLVHYMALTNQGIAQQMSAGPYDPGQRHPEWAWRTPAQGIRRISERYYLGWKLKRLGKATWMLYNDSNHAFFIEFGISEVGGAPFGSLRALGPRRVPARRIRRPVRKLSLRKTLEQMMRTQVYHRVWADIHAHPRYRPRGLGFTQHVQSPAKGSFSGAQLGRRLP